MVCYDDGDIVTALHLTERSQDGGDVLDTIFVGMVKPDKGVQQQQPGTIGPDGSVEPGDVELGIKVQGRCGDDVEVERLESEVAVGAESFEALANHRQSVLSEVDEGGSWLVDRECLQTRCSARDTDGHL